MVGEGRTAALLGAASLISVRIGVFSGAVSAVMIGMIALLMASEIAARAVGAPLAFSWEYASYMMGAAFLFGGAFAACSGGHVRVGLIADSASPAWRRALEFFAALLSTIVLGILFFALGDLALQHLARGTKSYTTMGTPLSIPVGLMAAGAACLFIQPLGWIAGLLSGRVHGFALGSADAAVIGRDADI